MSNEKTIQDGKKKKNSIKSLKERRAEKRMKKVEVKAKRKSRQKVTA